VGEARGIAPATRRRRRRPGIADQPPSERAALASPLLARGAGTLPAPRRHCCASRRHCRQPPALPGQPRDLARSPGPSRLPPAS